MRRDTHPRACLCVRDECAASRKRAALAQGLTTLDLPTALPASQAGRSSPSPDCTPRAPGPTRPAGQPSPSHSFPRPRALVCKRLGQGARATSKSGRAGLRRSLEFAGSRPAARDGSDVNPTISMSSNVADQRLGPVCLLCSALVALPGPDPSRARGGQRPQIESAHSERPGTLSARE